MSEKGKNLESFRLLFGEEVESFCRFGTGETVAEQQIFQEVFNGYSAFGSCTGSGIIQCVIPNEHDGKNMQNVYNQVPSLPCPIVESSFQGITSERFLPACHERANFLDRLCNTLNSGTVNRKRSLGTRKGHGIVKSRKTPFSLQNFVLEKAKQPDISKCFVPCSKHADGSSNNRTPLDLPARLRIYARDTLVCIGFHAETTIRKDGTKVDCIYKLPGRPSMNSLPKAWIECGNMLAAAPMDSSSAKSARQWVCIDAFMQDLADAIAYLDKNFHHPSSSLNVIQYFQLLDPFVIIVCIDHKVKALRAGKGVKVVNGRAFEFDVKNGSSIVEDQVQKTDYGCHSSGMVVKQPPAAEANSSSILFICSSPAASVNEKRTVTRNANRYVKTTRLHENQLVLCLFAPHVSQHKFNSSRPNMSKKDWSQNRKCRLGKELHERNLKHLARNIGNGSHADKTLRRMKHKGTSTDWNREAIQSRVKEKKLPNHIGDHFSEHQPIGSSSKADSDLLNFDCKKDAILVSSEVSEDHDISTVLDRNIKSPKRAVSSGYNGTCEFHIGDSKKVMSKDSKDGNVVVTLFEGSSEVDNLSSGGAGAELENIVTKGFSFYQVKIDAAAQKLGLEDVAVRSSLVSKDEEVSTNGVGKQSGKLNGSTENLPKPSPSTENLPKSSPLGMDTTKRVRKKSKRVAEIETLGASCTSKNCTSVSYINFDKILCPDSADNCIGHADAMESKLVSNFSTQIKEPQKELGSPIKLLNVGKMGTSPTSKDCLNPKVYQMRDRPSLVGSCLNRISLPDGNAFANKSRNKKIREENKECCQFVGRKSKGPNTISASYSLHLQEDVMVSNNDKKLRKIQCESYSEGSSCLASDDSQTTMSRWGSIKVKNCPTPKENQQKKPRVRINDDDLLISAVFRSKDFASNKKHPLTKFCPRPNFSKKHKGKRGNCRLLLRLPGKDGSLPINGSVITGVRTVLAWLIDRGIVCLKETIQYCSLKDHAIIKEGCITRDGVLCKCCNEMFSLSGFKFHAGYNLSRPCSNLFMGSGTPFTLCQLQAWSAEYRSRKVGKEVAETEEVDQNDDTCGFCGDGGDLVCCDGCPSTFHHECLSTEELPEGSWYCWSCTCQICGDALFSEEMSKPLPLLECAQCHYKYHKSCLSKEKFTVEDVSNTWFCSRGCQKVYSCLRSSVGVRNTIAEGFSWTMLRSSHVDLKAQSAQKIALTAECNTKIAISLAIMEESFLPMIDPRTQVDMIPHLLYNGRSRFARLNYEDFYTVILEKGDAVISVASIRVHGGSVAEIPLVATCSEHRRQGMCRRLLGAIEELLKSLKIKVLLLSAIPDLVDTWKLGFGFELIKEEERQQLSKINLMVFPGTLLLKKSLDKNFGMVNDASLRDTLQKVVHKDQRINIKVDEQEGAQCSSPFSSTRYVDYGSTTDFRADTSWKIFSNGNQIVNVSENLEEPISKQRCRTSSGVDFHTHNGSFVRNAKSCTGSINKGSKKRKRKDQNSCSDLIKKKITTKFSGLNDCHHGPHLLLELPDISKLTLDDDDDDDGDPIGNSVSVLSKVKCTVPR